MHVCMYVCTYVYMTYVCTFLPFASPTKSQCNTEFSLRTKTVSHFKFGPYKFNTSATLQSI